MISVEDALSRILSKLIALEAETVPTVDASGRVLASDVTAKLTQPPFDVSAMDGYGVRAEDLESLPTHLKIVGESAAGHGADVTVQSGEAVRIYTGAPTPNGVDTVVMQEDTESSREGSITILAAGAKGRHIRKAGVDFREGDVQLHAGQRLSPRHIGLLAAMNVVHVSVTRKPKVAILATGDELVPLGEPVGKEQIVSSIPPALCASLLKWGAEPVLLGIAQDTEESLKRTLAGAQGADMLLTIGGASVGDKDLVKQVLGEEGLEIDFWRIAMKPGKPFIYGTIKDIPLLGLPGNPVSALVCAELYVRPAIEALLGRSAQEITHRLHRAKSTVPLESNGKRQDYMRATLTLDDEGERHVTPCALQDSSVMSVLATADCLIVRPPGEAAIPAGGPVKVFLLDEA